MKKRLYKIETSLTESGVYIAYIPGLPGVTETGLTKKEAQENLNILLRFMGVDLKKTQR